MDGLITVGGHSLTLQVNSQVKKRRKEEKIQIIMM